MNRNDLKSYLEARGEKVIDLGVGYDHDQINNEIENGFYSEYTTIAHDHSCIHADHFYGDDQQEISFPLTMRGTDEMGRNIELKISSIQTLVDLINQWEHPQNVMLKVVEIVHKGSLFALSH